MAQVVKNSPASVGEAGRRCGFDPCVRKIPWRRKWQPTPVFLPGESHGQRSLWVQVIESQGSDTAEHTHSLPGLDPSF